MNTDPLKAAYRAAEEIAHAIAILKAIRRKSAKHPDVAQLIRQNVPRLVVAVRKLRRIEELPNMLANAPQLHSDVVRCGESAGQSYLDLALRVGEVSAIALLLKAGDTHDSLASFFSDDEVLVADVSGVLAAWDEPADWFSCLNDVGSGLDIALVKERRRLEDAAQKPDQLADKRERNEQADTPFPVKVSGNIVTVYDTEYPVQPHFAKWLELLLDARESGEKVTGKQFVAVVGRGKNVSREFNGLFAAIPPLADLIASDSGHGGGWYFRQ